MKKTILHGLTMEEMVTHSSILARRISWTEEPAALVHGVARVGHNFATKPPQLWRKYSLLNSEE